MPARDRPPVGLCRGRLVLSPPHPRASMRACSNVQADQLLRSLAAMASRADATPSLSFFSKSAKSGRIWMVACPTGSGESSAAVSATASSSTGTPLHATLGLGPRGHLQARHVPRIIIGGNSRDPCSLLLHRWRVQRLEQLGTPLLVGLELQQQPPQQVQEPRQRQR